MIDHEQKSADLLTLQYILVDTAEGKMLDDIKYFVKPPGRKPPKAITLLSLTQFRDFAIAYRALYTEHRAVRAELQKVANEITELTRQEAERTRLAKSITRWQFFKMAIFGPDKITDEIQNRVA